MHYCVCKDVRLIVCRGKGALTHTCYFQFLPLPAVQPVSQTSSAQSNLSLFLERGPSSAAEQEGELERQSTAPRPHDSADVSLDESFGEGIMCVCVGGGGRMWASPGDFGSLICMWDVYARKAPKWVRGGLVCTFVFHLMFHTC